MKVRTLGILAGITVVVIAVAVFLNEETTKFPSDNRGLVFPDLMSKINNVTELKIESTGETVTLARKEGSWGVKEKEYYPAALDKVKSLLIGIAELRFREPKTNNPELYEKLGLQNQKKEGSRATLITVGINHDQVAAKLLIGDQRPAKGNPSLSEIYIRKPEDSQTWLVTGKLPLERAVTEWLDQDILNLPGTRVRGVKIMHPGGESLIIHKVSPDALDFQIADMPKGYKVKSQFNVNNVVTTLSKLTFDDVKKTETMESEGKAGVKAVLETFDGLQVSVETLKKDEMVYGKITAEFNPSLVYKVDEAGEAAQIEKESKEKEGEAPESDTSEISESPKPTIKPAQEVKDEVTEMNKKLGEWVYELPKFKVDNFLKKKEELITKDS